jgi:hypothetical protein
MQTKLFSPRSAVCVFLLFGSLSSANVIGQTLEVRNVLLRNGLKYVLSNSLGGNKGH